MFDRISNHYDHFKVHRNYEAEADKLHEITETFHDDAQSVIELGCGTGSLLRALGSYSYRLAGLDQSPEMLAVAKSKLPLNTSLYEGTFESFLPPEKSDVVLWTDGAIGYVADKDIESTLSNIINNMTASDGLMLIEPWYSKDTWKYGENHLVTSESEEGSIFIRLSRGYEDGATEFHHLIATPEGVEYTKGFTNFHLHDYGKIQQILESQGTSVTRISPDKIYKRGLLVAKKNPERITVVESLGSQRRA